MKNEIRKDLTLKFGKTDVSHSFPVAFYTAYIAGVYIPYKKWVGEKCSCVFACPKFKTFAMDKWGIRTIPRNAQCPYVAGPCSGAHWYVRDMDKYVDGEKLRRRISPISLYTSSHQKSY